MAEGGLAATGASTSLMRATRSVEDIAFPRGAWERGAGRREGPKGHQGQQGQQGRDEEKRGMVSPAPVPSFLLFFVSGVLVLRLSSEIEIEDEIEIDWRPPRLPLRDGKPQAASYKLQAASQECLPCPNPIPVLSVCRLCSLCLLCVRLFFIRVWQILRPADSAGRILSWSSPCSWCLRGSVLHRDRDDAVLTLPVERGILARVAILEICHADCYG